MAKRKIIAKIPASLSEQAAKPIESEKVAPETDDKSNDVFDIMVRKIPEDARDDYLKVKKIMKKRGVTKLKNGDSLSLSGLMREAFLDLLERELKG